MAKDLIRIPRTVIALGVVSLLTDLSSEMIYPLLPIFLASVLGAGAIALGLIEGVAESTAALLKVASGVWTDRTQRRKPLVVAGYSLSGMMRPLIGLAVAWPAVLALRFADRVGKGLRTSPRDALIADVTDERARGSAYGFHRAMDHAGAVLGPLVAAVLLNVAPYRCGRSSSSPRFRRPQAWWCCSSPRIFAAPLSAGITAPSAWLPFPPASSLACCGSNGAQPSRSAPVVCSPPSRPCCCQVLAKTRLVLSMRTEPPHDHRTRHRRRTKGRSLAQPVCGGSAGATRLRSGWTFRDGSSTRPRDQWPERIEARHAHQPSPNGHRALYRYGINLGLVVLMSENSRSGLLWRLTGRCPYLVTGLRRAGFANGWLCGN